jgi:hypothetical protein
MPRIVRFLVTLVGVALASYAYLYWQTPGVGLSLALPAPAWWPFEHNAVWRSITWSQFAHTAVLAVVSIPMACAIQVFVPRKAVWFALAVTVLPALLIGIPMLITFGLQTTPRLQVIQLVDAAKLVTMLPLVVWLLGLGRRAAA